MKIKIACSAQVKRLQKTTTDYLVAMLAVQLSLTLWMDIHVDTLITIFDYFFF